MSDTNTNAKTANTVNENTPKNTQNPVEQSEKVTTSVSQLIEEVGKIVGNDTEHVQSVLRKAAEEKLNVIKENDGLRIENKKLRDKLRVYNDLNLLSLEGFDANQYDDIRKWCENDITIEKLRELKGKREYGFLLESARGIDTSRMGQPEKDVWSKWLTEGK